MRMILKAFPIIAPALLLAILVPATAAADDDDDDGGYYHRKHVYHHYGYKRHYGHHGYGHHGERISLKLAVEHAGVSINDLTDPAQIDPLSGNAVLNGVPVTVEPAPPSPGTGAG